MEFGTIQDKVESWLIDLPTGATAEIPGWINEAIKDAERRHNFRCMEDELLPTTTNNERVLVAKPSNWKETRADPYYYNQDGSTVEMDWAPSESEMVRTFAVQLPDEGNTAEPDEGDPKYVLEYDTEFHTYPLPDDESDWDDGNYRIVLPYWKYIDDLSGDTDTNFFTLESPYYVINKALALGFAWNRDEERASYYEGKAERLFQQLKRKDKLSRVGDRLVIAPRKDVYKGRSRSDLR